MRENPEPSLFVIFGGTGDLSRRKLLPALARNAADGHVGDRFRVVIVGRSPRGDDEFRRVAREALEQHSGLDTPEIDNAVARIHYHGLGEGTEEAYKGLATRLEDLWCREYDIPLNHSFYLSLPPRTFNPTINGLGAAGLNTDANGGWTRLVVEKPFGKDLVSAQKLNQQVHEYFDESQIYRIDHYLGKETVQNLLVYRLANAFIESSWNRDRIEAVQITVGEDLGVGTRAQYYDHSGALRDMVQNHLTQLLTLVAMAIYLDIKKPGAPLRLERIPLRFTYDDHFDQKMPGAYQTLLLDVLKGDQTLFVHGDEVEESWRVYKPLIDDPPKLFDYVAGTWGPKEAESFAIPEADLWQRKNV